MLIKTGTYKWNDVIDLTSTYYDLDLPIPFSLPNISANGNIANVQGTEISVLLGRENTSLNYLAYYFYIDDGSSEPSGMGASVYDEEYGWTALHNTTIPDLFPEGYGQIFTVTKDTEVDDTFGTWFDENTEPVVNTVAEVTYNGATLVSISAGETKTLKCAGKKMKTDIVITT